MTTGVRDRMILGAAQLLSHAGIAEATFGNLLARTGAPRGSIYHHFPGGKDELIAESMRHVGGQLLHALRRTELRNPEDVVIAFAGLFRRVLVDSGATAGCAVTAVTVASPADSTPGSAARKVFRSWRRELDALFVRAGLSATAAAALALTTLAAVEGAIVLSRAEGDIALFDQVVEQLVKHVQQNG